MKPEESSANSPKPASDQEDRAGSPSDSFERQAQRRDPGLALEFWEFLKTNKKWWVAPIVIVLLILSMFVLLTNSAIGPFIYVLF